MYRAQYRLAATTIALYHSLTALTAILLSMWVLSSSIAAGQWCGAALIVVGLVATTTAQSYADKEDHAHTNVTTTTSSSDTNGHTSNGRHANEASGSSDQQPLLTDTDQSTSHDAIERGHSPTTISTTATSIDGPRQRATVPSS
jgi:hypothetical protein